MPPAPQTTPRRPSMPPPPPLCSTFQAKDVDTTTEPFGLPRPAAYYGIEVNAADWAEGEGRVMLEKLALDGRTWLPMLPVPFAADGVTALMLATGTFRFALSNVRGAWVSLYRF